MSEVLHHVQIRGREYDVYVKNSISPITTLRFNYNKTELDHQVFLPDDLSDQDINRILTDTVKKAIHNYNRKMRSTKSIQ